MTEQNESTEQMVQDKNLNAPRMTPDAIMGQIKDTTFKVFEGSQLTVCVLTLQNGFTVTGESACVSPENFDAEIGQKVSRENAIEKIWMLEGYRLKQHLFEESNKEAKGFFGRLNDECNELLEKKNKLGEFFNTEKFQELSSSAQNLLTAQHGTMSKYAEILIARLDLLEVEDHAE